MIGSEEITLIVSFLREESVISITDLEKRLEPVSKFFNRNSKLGIISHKLQHLQIHRSGGRGARPKDRGDGLLYEAPFAEAKYSVEVRTRYSGKGERISPFPYIYQKWCEEPPALDAWLSRGGDQHLMDGVNETKMRDEIDLLNLSFGSVINLTDFCPECEIECKEERPQDGPYISAKVAYASPYCREDSMDVEGIETERIEPIRHPGTYTSLSDATPLTTDILLQASFHHAYRDLKILLTMHHTCDEYHGKLSKYMLEIEYSSIARAIVDLREKETYVYLRLTHPVILYGTKPLDKNAEVSSARAKFREFDRVNVLTHPHSTKPHKCHVKLGARLFGGTNTLRLKWKNGRGLLLTLHSILAKLQRSESVIASMTNTQISKSVIKKVRLI